MGLLLSGAALVVRPLGVKPLEVMTPDGMPLDVRPFKAMLLEVVLREMTLLMGVADRFAGGVNGTMEVEVMVTALRLGGMVRAVEWRYRVGLFRRLGAFLDGAFLELRYATRVREENRSTIVIQWLTRYGVP